MKKNTKILIAVFLSLVLLLAAAACKKQVILEDEAGSGSLTVDESGQPIDDGTTTPDDGDTGDTGDTGNNGGSIDTGDNNNQGAGDNNSGDNNSNNNNNNNNNSSDNNNNNNDNNNNNSSSGDNNNQGNNSGDDDEGLTWGSGSVIKVISQNVLMDGSYNNATKKITHINYEGTVIQADNRRPIMKEVLTPYDADCMGFQEVTWRWKEWLGEDFAGYTQRGIMRYGDNYAGSASNELDLLMYKTDKFNEIKSETIWLSDTPYIEASKTWGGTNPCTFVYALLEIKETGENIAHFTTHYSHDSEEAQIKAGAQMSEFIINFMEKNQQNGHTIPIYATGDYNILPESEGYMSMCEALTDPITIAKEKVGENTFPSWNHDEGEYGLEPTRRIDFCFVNAASMVVDKYEVIRGTVNGIPPSDHYGLYIESRINTLI